MQILTGIIALVICSFSTTIALPNQSPHLDLIPTAENVVLATFSCEINGTTISVQGGVSDFIAAVEAQYPGHLAAQAHLLSALPSLSTSATRMELIAFQFLEAQSGRVR